MIKILFTCHGNICRSPMAEFVLKNMVKEKGIENHFYIASAATSTEEIGSPVYFGTRNKLKEYGIATDGKYAVQLKKSDYKKYDYLLGMDQRNIVNMKKILGGDPKGKIKRLLEYTKNARDIKDPWYTGDFDETYQDVYEGCKELLDYILGNHTEII